MTATALGASHEQLQAPLLSFGESGGVATELEAIEGRVAGFEGAYVRRDRPSDGVRRNIPSRECERMSGGVPLAHAPHEVSGVCHSVLIGVEERIEDERLQRGAPPVPEQIPLSCHGEEAGGIASAFPMMDAARDGGVIGEGPFRPVAARARHRAIRAQGGVEEQGSPESHQLR
ncbi:MAG TPA: hypothetical protein VF697_42720 [Archangium sp.]